GLDEETARAAITNTAVQAQFVIAEAVVVSVNVTIGSVNVPACGKKLTLIAFGPVCYALVEHEFPCGVEFGLLPALADKGEGDGRYEDEPAQIADGEAEHGGK